MDCTTFQNMCLRFPKHPRSSRNSKVNPSSDLIRRNRQNVRRPATTLQSGKTPLGVRQSVLVPGLPCKPISRSPACTERPTRIMHDPGPWRVQLPTCTWPAVCTTGDFRVHTAFILFSREEGTLQRMHACVQVLLCAVSARNDMLSVRIIRVR